MGNSIDAETKKKSLEQKYKMKMTRELEGGIQSMCNVGSGLVEKGKKEGIVIGEVKSLVETYQEFCKSVEETTQKLMDKFQMSEEEARENVSKYWKK